MRTVVDKTLRDEAARFRLRFACDDCAHFSVERARCAHGYAAAPRARDLEAPELTFCKEFELG
jgi:hypothetical protein